jgi:hypothetical protein
LFISIKLLVFHDGLILVLGNHDVNVDAAVAGVVVGMFWLDSTRLALPRTLYLPDLLLLGLLLYFRRLAWHYLALCGLQVRQSLIALGLTSNRLHALHIEPIGHISLDDIIIE